MELYAEIIIIGLAAFFAAVLTFYSGFGLGTVLMAVLSMFFPVSEAVFITAIVHFLNGLLKLVLLRKEIQMDILKKFGIPSAIGAGIGAIALLYLSDLEPLFAYQISGRHLELKPINFSIALIIVFFVFLDLIPKSNRKKPSDVSLYFGGLFSGFFGGLSGHQGALRSMFLVRYRLTKYAFIATGACIAFFVDIIRISIYSVKQNWDFSANSGKIILASIVCAGLGTLIGNRLLPKVTFTFVQALVTILLLFIAIGLGMGIFSA